MPMGVIERTHATAELEVLDPATGEAIGRIPAGSTEAADAAVCRARAAYPAWARMDPAERAAILKAGARELRAHARELAELQTRENGRPLIDSAVAVEAGIGAIEQYAERGPQHGGGSGRARGTRPTWSSTSHAASWRCWCRGATRWRSPVARSLPRW